MAGLNLSFIATESSTCYYRFSCTGLVWKVARYTSAAPSYFDELDNYVDGGVLANNPSSSALTKIQNMYRLHRQKLPISVLVSIGSGKMPEEELGRTDAHQFAYFGKHWFKSDDKLMERTANLLTLLSNAVSSNLVPRPQLN